MVSCGAGLIKYLLFFFNILWLVLGGVILWLGFSIASYSGDLKDIYESNMKAGAVVVIVAGIVIFVLAFLGCCGAIKENSCMLSTYGGIILILVVLQCVGAYFAFKNKTNIEDEFSKQVEEKMEDFDKNPTVSDKVKEAVQNFQKTFKCCGVDNPDYWLHHPSGSKDYPNSCCGLKWDKANARMCTEPDSVYKEGCVPTVKDTVGRYLGGLGGAAIALVLLQLIIVLAACCLSREVRH